MTMMMELIIRIQGEAEKTTPTAVTLDGNGLHQQLIYHLLHLLLRSTHHKHRIIGEENTSMLAEKRYERFMEESFRATRVRD